MKRIQKIMKQTRHLPLTPSIAGWDLQDDNKLIALNQRYGTNWILIEKQFPGKTSK
jgi:hypothetical protein